MKETRILVGAEIRTASAKQMRVSGLAARYNSVTTIGDAKNKRSFREVLAPGAFRAALTPAALKENDPTFRVNHDPNQVMGRLSAGTLRLRESGDGLEFECDFPDSEAGRNAYESIRRGDIRHCSFGFDDVDDDWEIDGDRKAKRTIRSIRRLSDVSAVTEPAYRETFVNARSEQRSQIEIPQQFIVEEPETDSVEAIARRRQLLGIALI
jgi:HK97 family phage prohead protease